MRGKSTKLVAVIGLAGVLMLAGCANDAQTGLALGSLVGAGLGQAIGRNTGGTLIGAAVGGGAGYMIGNESDKQKTAVAYERDRQDLYVLSNTQVVNVHNSNGSVTQVRMTREGGRWVGPRGEIYDALPAEAQLRPVYGF